MTVATSTLSPQQQRQGKTVPVDRLYLDEIPGAMDKMGWRVSAALMRRWFATKPAWVMGERERASDDLTTVPSSRIESSIVTMDWLLGYPSVRSAFEELQASWQTRRGIAHLRDRLYAAGWRPGERAHLGYGIRSAVTADKTCQVNFKVFGKYTDTFNDLFGAINKATLKLAVRGKATRLPNSFRDVFEIEKIGFYCRDSYDFNADWTTDNAVGLSVWSRERCLSKLELAVFTATPLERRSSPFPGFVPVMNRDFRRWQKARNEGGDFYVFSDIRWLDPLTDHVALS